MADLTARRQRFVDAYLGGPDGVRGNASQRHAGRALSASPLGDTTEKGLYASYVLDQLSHQVSLYALYGQFVVLDYCAMWCPPCVSEASHGVLTSSSRFSRRPAPPGPKLRDAAHLSGLPLISVYRFVDSRGTDAQLIGERTYRGRSGIAFAPHPIRAREAVDLTVTRA